MRVDLVVESSKQQCVPTKSVVEDSMPHRIDIDSIRQNLFVLMHLAYGAEHFARKHDLETDFDYIEMF